MQICVAEKQNHTSANNVTNLLLDQLIYELF